MVSDFRKLFVPIDGFNCLKMKHDIQTKIHEKTKNMTQEQRLEYYRQGALKLRRGGGIRSIKTQPFIAAESSPPYGKTARRNG